jgi:LPS export ABC transporter protein LptC
MSKRMLFALIALFSLIAGGITLVSTRSAQHPPAAPAVVAPPPSVGAVPEQPTVDPAALTALDKAWQQLEASKGNRVVGTEVTFTVTQGAQKQWDVLVKKAIYFDDQQGAELKGLSGTFYNKAGQPTAEFVAPYGTYDQAKEHLELKGNVSVHTIKGKAGGQAMALTAPTITWNGSDPMLHATGGIHLQAGTFANTTANTAAFSLDMSQINLSGNTVSSLKR